MEFINGNLGSGVTMLYPSSMLKGKGAVTDMIGIAVATEGQNQDTGAKVYHLASHTKSTIVAKSISKDGGMTTYRGYLKVNPGAKGCASKVQCDALLLDEHSISNTVPAMEVKENDVDLAHEATVGRIGEEQLFYLQSRGLSAQRATQMIVAGFIEPVAKQLPLEYAVELNRLIELEMEGSVG
jgi:Fe-S cluster assembly protein SufB